MFDEMRADLPEETAPQMALESVLRRLVPFQPRSTVHRNLSNAVPSSSHL